MARSRTLGSPERAVLLAAALIGAALLLQQLLSVVLATVVIGAIAALVVVALTAQYTAIRPQPLVDGALALSLRRTDPKSSRA